MKFYASFLLYKDVPTEALVQVDFSNSFKYIQEVLPFR